MHNNKWPNACAPKMLKQSLNLHFHLISRCALIIAIANHGRCRFAQLSSVHDCSGAARAQQLAKKYNMQNLDAIKGYRAVPRGTKNQQCKFGAPSLTRPMNGASSDLYAF